MNAQPTNTNTCPRCGYAHKDETPESPRKKHQSPGRTPLARQAVLVAIGNIPAGEAFHFNDVVSLCKGEASSRTVHNVMSELHKTGDLVYLRPSWKQIQKQETGEPLP